MSIPVGAARIVLGGSLPGGEIWETGFWLTGTGVDTSDHAHGLALVIDATLSSADVSGAMRATLTAICSTDTTWEYTKAYGYPTGGTKATAVGIVERTPILHGASGSRMPNQCACVLTLRSNTAGRSSRGRMYLPCSGTSLDATAQLHQDDISTITTAWATAFTDINASDTGKVVIVSQAKTTSIQVSQVTADTRMDIQRRRANSQAITGTSIGAVTV